MSAFGGKADIRSCPLGHCLAALGQKMLETVRLDSVRELGRTGLQGAG